MLLLFDLDDTLVHSSLAYEEGLRSLGISSQHPLFQRARREVKASLPSGAPQARNRSLYFKRFLELDGGYSPLRHLEMLSKYEDSLMKNMKKQWLELKRDRLFAMLAQKHRLFIVTNEILRTQSLKLQMFDPHFKYFSGMICSEEAGVEKPHLDIFRKALERANGNVESTLMIGDSFEMDMAPALELGLRAIQSLEFVGASESARRPEQSAILKLRKLDQIFDVDPSL
jgi:HAD superfamily hydrolase (TIGR01549 family)